MARHQWDSLGLPTVGGSGERPHHYLEVGGRSLRRQVCASTACLPPVLAEVGDDSLGKGELPPLEDGGPGYAALGLSGYADDTQAVALGTVAIRGTVPTTED